MRLVLIKISRVALIEKQWLENAPGLLILAPMLAKDIGRVVLTHQMVDSNNHGSNSFADTMEGESIVALVKLGMWNGRTVHDTVLLSPNMKLLCRIGTPR
jgi:hypothetical protein